ncbi:MAG: NAD(P)/FAD-dependent oxidoreductase [Clostridia bacterium]|nr:NAD(P)/FAD-dependent oxidoreductase [Clostridia bacterium]
MAKYDIVIVGASTAGSYFARRMAERGFSVFVIDRSTKDRISPDYDIFHMGKDEMDHFGLPKVEKGDGIYAFEFTESYMYSAFGGYPKPSPSPVVGMHKHGYIVRMNEWAAEAGAEIVYEASFVESVYDESGKICGIVYEKDGEKISVECRLVADCSGIPAVVRRSLPDSYGIEKFELTPDDILFVTLRYVDFTDKKEEWMKSHFWIFYKSWVAPSAGSDAIIGMGSCFGFDYVEKVYEQFTKNVKLPAHRVKWIERGMTPYHRAPYSFVADGFIAMGDAVCMTKPNCGEGCTAALVLEDIAVDVASKALENGAYPTRESLWSINKKYNGTQGKEFASLLALLASVIRHSAKANEFLFKHDVIFSKKILGGMSGGLTLNVTDYLKTLVFVVVGLASGQIKISEIKSILSGVINSGKLTELYERFPETPDGFDAWVREAEEVWSKTDRLADWKPMG